MVSARVSKCWKKWIDQSVETSSGSLVDRPGADLRAVGLIYVRPLPVAMGND